MKVLILGGTRFHGRYTALRLRDLGYDVTTLTRTKLDDRNHVQADRKNHSHIREIICDGEYSCIIDNTCYKPGDLTGIVMASMEKEFKYIFSSSVMAYLEAMIDLESKKGSKGKEEPKDKRPKISEILKYGYNINEIEYAINKKSTELVAFKYIERCRCMRIHNVIGRHDFSGKSKQLVNWLLSEKSDKYKGQYMQFATKEIITNYIVKELSGKEDDGQSIKDIALPKIDLSILKNSFCKDKIRQQESSGCPIPIGVLMDVEKAEPDRDKLITNYLETLDGVYYENSAVNQN
tara:strand:- start:468 stop:1343 length:876 start_codon:yes stop_codon:yes gene_type:complete